ncbi:MAG: hypothetical protein V3R62_09005 [Acidiferrobacterales bacterium]
MEAGSLRVKGMVESKGRLPGLIPAVGAAILWGTWALYANYEHSLSTGAVAALTQAIAAFFLTFYISLSVAFLFDRCGKSVWKVICPVVGTVGVQGTLLVLIHYYAKTPEILKTTALPIALATLYCSYLTYLLFRRQAAEGI